MKFRVIVEAYNRQGNRWWPPITTTLADTAREAKIEALRLAENEDRRSKITITDDDYHLVEVIR